MLIAMSSPQSIPREKTIAFLAAVSRHAASALIGTACGIASFFGLSGPGASASAVAPAFVAPLPSPLRVLRGFAPPARPWLAGNRGVDLAASTGEPVFAAGAGTVLYAGLLAGRGVISVDHGGLRTTYEPVDPLVSVGAAVSAGQLIARVSAVADTCGPPGTCLHWGAIRDGAYIDPMSLLPGPSAVRLLPIWSDTLNPSANTAPSPTTEAPVEHAPNAGKSNTERAFLTPNAVAAPGRTPAPSTGPRRGSPAGAIGKAAPLAGGAGAAIFGLVSLRRPRARAERTDA